MHEIVALEQGRTYYATVRAITGDGSALDSSTDGFTVDSSPPQASLSVLAAAADVNYADADVVYTPAPGVQLQPGMEDSESGIAETWLSVGSYRGTVLLHLKACTTIELLSHILTGGTIVFIKYVCR